MRFAFIVAEKARHSVTACAAACASRPAASSLDETRAVRASPA
jgi:hypothetical protein